MPNMVKRRFSDKIVPIVRNEMSYIINILNRQLLATTQNSPNAVIISNLETTNEMEASNAVIPTGMEASNNIDIEIFSRGTETRKRKCSLPKSKSVSSIDSYIADIDADLPPKQQPIKAAKRICDSNQANNVVHTMQEAYRQYRTFAPTDQQMPEVANPPDTARHIQLNLDASTDSSLNFITSCVETSENSSPKYSLITLHSKGNVSLPKSHLCVNILPECLHSSKLNMIPENGLFVFELLLLDQAFQYYKVHLENFLIWSKERGAPIFFTVPTEYSEELIQSLNAFSLTEIPRPFQLLPSTSTTT
jgi:hypothetical protein